MWLNAHFVAPENLTYKQFTLKNPYKSAKMSTGREWHSLVF